MEPRLDPSLKDPCTCGHAKWHHLPLGGTLCTGVSEVEGNRFDCICPVFTPEKI